MAKCQYVILYKDELVSEMFANGGTSCLMISMS